MLNFDTVEEFENIIARFYSAPYAVATDSCTHAIELCLRYKHIKQASCPTNTYLSVPMTFEKLGINWSFRKEEWQDYYNVVDNIYDAAVLWKSGSYIPNSLMCVSFQFRKHLGLGRGGVILCNYYKDYVNLKKMSYDGRLPGIPWAEQDIDMLGYHYYMTPETAQLGIDKFKKVVDQNPKIWSNKDYPDLSQMKVFKNVK
jgi:dTDP-4-amino-4,6-dideoxygalactose transaminase